MSRMIDEAFKIINDELVKFMKPMVLMVELMYMADIVNTLNLLEYTYKKHSNWVIDKNEARYKYNKILEELKSGI